MKADRALLDTVKTTIEMTIRQCVEPDVRAHEMTNEEISKIAEMAILAMNSFNAALESQAPRLKTNGPGPIMAPTSR